VVTPNLAVVSAKASCNVFRALAAAEPNNDEIQSKVGLSLQRLGEALRAATSRASLQQIAGVSELHALAGKELGEQAIRTDVVLALWRLASAGDEPHTIDRGS